MSKHVKYVKAMKTTTGEEQLISEHVAANPTAMKLGNLVLVKEADESEKINSLRKEYKALYGKNVPPNWKASTIERKIAEYVPPEAVLGEELGADLGEASE